MRLLARALAAAALALAGLLALSAPAAAQACGTTVTLGAGACTTTLLNCVSQIPPSLAGNYCIDIPDSLVHTETAPVVVANVATNNFRIYIGPLAATNRPVIVGNIAGQGVFVVTNASVTLQGMMVKPGVAGVSYGVYASSQSVSLTSMTVADNAASFMYMTGGVFLTSASAVTYSSVSVSNAYGLVLSGSGSQVTLSTAANNSSTAYALWLAGSSNNLLARDFFGNKTSTAAFLDAGSNFNIIDRSTMTGGTQSAMNATGGAGLVLNGASFNSFKSGVFTGGAGTTVGGGQAPGGPGLSVTGGGGNGFSQGIFSGGGGGTGSNGSTLGGGNGGANGGGLSAGGAGAFFINSATNTFVNDFFFGGGGGNGAGATGGGPGLWLVGTSSTTVLGSVLSGGGGGGGSPGAPGGNGGSATSGGIGGNGVSAGCCAGATGANGLSLTAGSGPTTVGSSWLFGGGGGGAASGGNAGPGGYGAFADFSSSVTIAGSVLSGGGGGGGSTAGGAGAGGSGGSLAGGGAGGAGSPGVNLPGTGGSGLQIQNNATGWVVASSTMSAGVAGAPSASTSGAAGLWLQNSYNATVQDSYVVGSTAALVATSTGTLIGDSTLVVTATNGFGLSVSGGSSDLTLTSSTILGVEATVGVTNGGIYISPANGGRIQITTNTVRGNLPVGLYAGVMAGGGQLYIASNTFVPALSATAGVNSYGLILDSLQTGTTVTDNSVYYRAAGGAAGNLAHGIKLQGTNGVIVDHNRFSDPGMVASGQYYGALLNGAVNTRLRYNDFHGTTASGVGGVLLQAAAGSTGLSAVGNVFFSSFSAPGAGVSSGTVLLPDPGTAASFFADYNDYASSNGVLSFQWSATSAQGLANWRAVTLSDSRSFSGHPQWTETAPGDEDFHPRSKQGRWSPAAQTFLTDAADSPTIDRGDPGDPPGGEALPNGMRANQGSYGGTAEASKTSNGTYPGCAHVTRVGAGFPNLTIGAGVSALPTVLSGPACVIIEDNGPYNEQVTVANFVVGTSSISIFADSGTAPVVVPPPGATAAFLVTNDSVSLSGLTITASAATVPYGIYGSSASLTVSSVTVSTVGVNGFSVSAIRAGARAVVAYSTVSVYNAGGLTLAGAGATVVASSVTSVIGTALDVVGASATVQGCWLATNGGIGAFFETGSGGSALVNSTVTVGGASAVGVRFGASSSTVASSVFTGTGTAVYFANAASSNTLVASHVGVNAGGGNAVDVFGSSNSVVGSVIATLAGQGVRFEAGASSNTVSFTTVTVPAGYSGVVFNAGASSNTIVSSVLSAGTAYAAYVAGDSNSIVDSSMTSQSGSGLYISGGASNTFLRDMIASQSGAAFGLVSGASGNGIVASTATSAAGQALFANNASSNSISLSYLGGAGANQLQGVRAFRFDRSVLYAGSSYGLYLVGASSCVVTGSTIASQNQHAVWATAGSNGNVITNSTMTANNSLSLALWIDASSGNVVSSSYLLAPATAAYVTGSTATVLSGLRIAAGFTSIGYGVRVGGQSGDFTLDSSTVTGAAGTSQGGLTADAGNSGVFAVTRTTFSDFTSFGVSVTSPAAGASVYIASNTFLPAMVSGMNQYGLTLTGLSAGATVENNSVYWRLLEGVGGGGRYGVYAYGSSGLSIRRNRIAAQNVMGSDAVAGVWLDSTTVTRVRDNDIALGMGVSTTLSALQVTNQSRAIDFRGNAMSISAAGGSAFFWTVDPTSLTGFSADYNLYDSRNGLNSVQYNLAARTWPWAAFTGGADARSIVGGPLWISTVAYQEDFHPRSAAGRCIDSPACTTFVADGVTSPMIDAGDPAADYSAEPAYNGYRRNLGSYGGTNEASKSPAPPAPCGMALRLCQNGTCPNQTLQGAFDGLPNPFPADACVLFEDSASYAVSTITALNNAGFRLYVMPDPATASKPFIRPALSYAGLLVQNATVTISGLTIAYNGAMGSGYGILASSPSVVISTVFVDDTLGNLTQAGIAVSSNSTVQYSTVTTQVAHGIYSDATLVSVLYSSVTNVGAAGAANKYGLFLLGATTATVTGSLFEMHGTGDALHLDHTKFTGVSRSTFNSTNGMYAAALLGASNDGISGSYLYNGGGRALYLDAQSDHARADASTFSAISAGNGIVEVSGASHKLTNSLISSANGDGLHLVGVNFAVVSSVTVQANQVPGFALQINGAYGNTVSYSKFSNATGDGAVFIGAPMQNVLSYSTATSGTSGGSGLKVYNGPTANSAVASYFGNSANGNGANISGSSFSVVGSTVYSASGVAAYLVAATTNSLTGDWIQSGSAYALSVDGTSSSNTVSGCTLTAQGAGPSTYAMYVTGSSNTVFGSFVNGGAWFDSAAHGNWIVLSTAATTGLANAVYLATASFNTVHQSYLSAAGADTVYLRGNPTVGNAVSSSTIVNAAAAGYNGVRFDGNAALVSGNRLSGDFIHAVNGNGVYMGLTSSNTVAASTVTTSGTVSYPLLMANAAANTVTQSYVANDGGGPGALLQFNSDRTVLDRDQFYASGRDALEVDGSSDVVVLGGSAYGLDAVEALNTYRFQVRGSTFTASSGAALKARGALATTVAASYLEGANGFVVAGSTLTTLLASTAAANAAGGSAVFFTAGQGLTVATSTVYGAGAGYGVYVDSNVTGSVLVSTNVFPPGPLAQVFVGTNSVSNGVSIASNTFFPTLSPSADTAGVLVAGPTLSVGVHQNDFLFRSAGSVGASNVVYAVRVVGGSAPQVDHNRVSEPAMVSGGGIVGFSFQGASAAALKSNDFYGTGSGLALARGIQLTASPNASVRDNILYFDLRQSFLSAAAVQVDAASQAGYVGDYNDVYIPAANVNAKTGSWGGVNYTTLSNWTVGSGMDSHSLAQDPVWASVGAGSEDFHPKSTAGRWTPPNGAFLADAQTSPTLDAADPTEPVGDEPQPNDGRLNQGSYGGTTQASKTAPPPGCSVEYTVAPNFYATISDAVAAVGNNLTNDPCVVVRYNALAFPEQVNVSGIATNGHRLTIMGGVNMVPAPTIDGGGQAVGAFNITNDSVTIRNLNVVSSGLGSPFGVHGSSAALTISSVTVAGSFSSAAVFLTTGATVVNSSATAAAAHGFVLSGPGATVIHSSAGYTGAAASFYPLFAAGASASTVTQFYASGGADPAAMLRGVSGVTVAQSTFTSSASGSLYLDTVVDSTVTASVVWSGGGQGLYVSYGGRNTVSFSTATSVIGYGAFVTNSASNTFATDAFTGASAGLYMANSAANAVLGSTAAAQTPAANAFASPGAMLINSDRNILLGSIFLGAAAPVTAVRVDGAAGLVLTNSSLNQVLYSTATGGAGTNADIATTGCIAGTGGPGLNLAGSSNTITGSCFQGGAGGSVVTGAACSAPVQPLEGGAGGAGVSMTAAGNNTVVTASTMTGGASGTTQTGAVYPGGGIGLLMGSSSNTVTASVIAGGAGGPNWVGGARGGNGGFGLEVPDANTDLVQQSVMTGGAGGIQGTGGVGAYFFGGSSCTVTGSFLLGGPAGAGAFSGGGHGVQIVTGVSGPSQAVTISFSTAAGAQDGFGVYALNGSSHAVVGSYVQGSSAAVLTNVVAGAVDQSVLVATGAAAMGLTMNGASAGLRATRNSVRATNAEVYIDGGQGGAILIASNTFAPGSFVGVYVATTAAGATVVVASNTIVQSAVPGYGLYLNGVTVGTTVQYNSFYYRGAPASVGTATVGHVYALSSPGVRLDHNRFSQPGLVTAGSYDGVQFIGSPNATVKFNDFYGAAAPGGLLTNAFLLDLQWSANSVVKDNVFASSFTVSAASASVTLDMASAGGYQSDYNDYYSSTSRPSILRAGVATPFPWSASLFMDYQSTSVPPRWPSTVPNAEDFHPLSQAGRWSPSAGTFVLDSWTAGTIDAADPAEPLGAEPSYAGLHANLGSYGGTSEASKTPAPPSSLAVAAVYSSSVAVSYVGGAAQGEIVAASTVPSFANAITSGPAAGQSVLAPQGLSPNTTYHLTAASVYGEMTAVSPVTLTTVTLAAVPAAPTGAAFLGAFPSSAVVRWSASGNPPSVTTYTVVVTTSPFYPNANAYSGIMSTIPAGGSPSAAFLAPNLTNGVLIPNSTVYLFVSAVNWGGTPSPYALAGTTITPPAVPAAGAPSFVAATGATLTVQWGAAYNPLALTAYTLMASTASDFNAFASSVTLSTSPAAGPSATLSGLSPNTTYFVRVAVVGVDGSTSAYVVLGSTSTGTATPIAAAPAFTSVAVSLLAVQWAAGLNPPGTLYDVMTATTPAFTGAVTSSYTYSLSLSTSGLDVSTTYFFQVSAIDNLGRASSFLSLGSTSTLAAAPAVSGAPFLVIGPSSATVTWLSGGNRAGAPYLVVLSTAGDFNVGASSVTLATAPTAGLTATLSGLSAYTNYFLGVAAISNNGYPTALVSMGSAFTQAPGLVPPVLQTFTAASTTTLTATWTLAGGATGYAVLASTESQNPPMTVWASSSPAGIAATTATLAGLAPNTTYFVFVRSLGPNAASAFAGFAATSTLAAAPLSVASTFSAVAITSFSAAWSANGNPLAMTTYTVVASTDPAFSATASSVTFSTVPAAGASAMLAGLMANSTYYVQVRALGHGDQASAFAFLGSTVTAPDLPTLSGPPFVASSSDTLTVSWGPGANPLAVTTYAIVASTASDFNAWASSVTLSTAPAAGPSALLTGLLPNATYFVEVRTVGAGGSSTVFVGLGSSATLAAPPAAAAFSGVTNGVIQANWAAAPNPPGTLFELQASTDPLYGGVVTSSLTYNLFVSSAGLAANTTHYFRVRALNHASLPSAFASLAGTATLANAPLPGPAAFVMVGVSSVTLSWLANGDPLGITTYTIVASTASDFNAFASSVTFSTAPAAGPAATVTGLAFGTTYYFEVRAVNHDGVATAFANLGSTYTALSQFFPLIANHQGGDAQWRRTNDGLYDVRFQDGSGSHLDKFEVKASTTPGGLGTDLVAYTPVAINLAPADAYSTPWPLPAAVYAALLEGVTNYISVRVTNGLANVTVAQDAFFVLKDTTSPTFVNGVVGDAVVRSTGGTTYAFSAADAGSGLAAFQYSASTNTLADASRVPWTDIAPLNGATYYQTPWTVNFAALLSGVTNYVSVRTWDVAGATVQVNNAFFVLKDTAGPVVAVSSPAVGVGFVSAFDAVVGVSSSPFGVKGDEVAVLQTGINLYWNPLAGLFNSGTPVWMPAVGRSTWSFSLSAHSIALADGVAYKIVARSSTTFDQYSTSYATASFVLDLATPTVGVQSPGPNATVGSLPVISGTSADPGTAPSGVASVEVRLMRFSDGKWWNWFTDSWSAVPVSTIPAATANWSVAPSALLQANLLSGSSYFIAVRASDNALPANAGNFITQGSTFTFSNPTPPAAVTNLGAVSGPAPGDVLLTWTATGDHGSSGTVLQGQYAVFGATYAAATPSTSTAQVFFSTANVAAGAASGLVVSNLSAGVTYYFAIALQNTDGNWSGFSNQASTVATPAPLNAILGHVVDASTTGITGVEVDAWNSAGALVSTAFTLADGSGTFSVGGLTPGNYKLQASWTVNGVTSSVWQDNIAMGSTNVDFSLNINYALATLTGSLATLTTSAARTGTSPAALARPAAGSSFVEVSQRSRAITRVGVQPNGRWTVSGLLPGQYAVRAFTGVEFTDYQQVTLAEGETRQIGFVFDPLPNDSVFAFPNPAKDSTTFRFLTPFAVPFEAVIDVFDVAGRLVKEIPGSDIQPTATTALYHATWDLTNSRGQAVASGVYLYVVKVKDQGGTVVKVVKKLAVVR